MSYNPNQNYGFPTNPGYYVDDAEEYVPEYIDSEGLSDHHQLLQMGQPNVTEIFSRNDIGVTPQKQIAPNQLGFYPNQGQYVQQYYYENPPGPQARHLTAIPVQEYTLNTPYDPRYHQYCPLATSSLHDTNFDTAAFRSAHHGSTGGVPAASAASAATSSAAPPGHANCQRGYQEGSQPVAAPKQTVKRYPVKVGTPKYYSRKAQSHAVYKRPSALCLPVASQPDPAVHKKHKKPPVAEFQYVHPQTIKFANDRTDTQNKTSDQVVTDHKVDSEGDFNLTVSKLEDMFAQIENQDEATGSKNKNDIAKFARFLKPRMPPSIKVKQDQVNVKTTKGENDNGQSQNGEAKGSKTEGQDEDDTVDSIERLLNQLKKCELAVCSNDAANTGNKRHGNINLERNDQEIKQMPPIRTKSFNYQDITSQMTKSKSEMRTFERDIENEHCLHGVARRLNLSMSASRRSFASKPPLDDNCALELHRSKSYIVNLIDRALSKELGTVPSNRTHKEFNDMSPRKAIDMVNRHSCSNSDKNLCLEITSALTDSIISNAPVPNMQEVNHFPLPSFPLPSSASSSKAKVCCCNAEEPPYIKQLKQLRWGHLKHIQREVRRLEDLERFLDSCSLNPISEI